MTRKTYYDTLQVSRHASPSVIKAAFKALSQKHHPDKNPDDLETANKNMKRLNEAYGVLSDSERKTAYDEHIEALIAEPMQGTKKPSPPPPHASPPPSPFSSTPTPPPSAPTPPPSDTSNSSSLSPVAVTACVLIAVVFVIAGIANRSDLPENDGVVTVPSPTNDMPVPAPSSTQSLVVAALNANVRREPSTKSKAIAQVARGASVEQISEVNGFVKFTLPDGREGWISRDIVVPRFAAIRLGGLSATDYVSARAPLRGIERLFTALEKYRELQTQALFQIVSESPQLDETLHELANTVRITADNIDADAASWYSLEAKYNADNNKLLEGLDSARAAVLADPSNVDAHVALAYAAIKLNQFEVLKSVAIVLPTLAPNSTNTWVIVGMSAANNNDTVLAVNSLQLALRKSRNPKVTTQVLADLASRSSNPKVSHTINTALELWNQRP